MRTLHQGVACCAIAGAVIASILLHQPQCTLEGLDQHLLRAYRRYRRWCKQNQVAGSCLRFTRARFNKEKWSSLPDLSNQYKASTVKYMQFWLHPYLMDNRVAGDEDLVCMSYSLASFQYMLDTRGPWMSLPDRSRTADYGNRFLLFYQRLAGQNRGHRRNFKIIPKCHYFCHMIEYIATTGRNVRYLVYAL